MKDTLVVGLALETSYVVTQDMAPPHLPAVVLSTPTMIQHIEAVCLETVQPHLSREQVTVGTHVNVSHTGPALEGESFTVRSELAEIRKRRLTFSVSVHSPRGEISSGTHERAVVELSRFQA